MSFLESYREGICQHYATAATAMYRALGIPARYVVGYMGQTEAGEWTEITLKDAHAWVGLLKVLFFRQLSVLSVLSMVS